MRLRIEQVLHRPLKTRVRRAVVALALFVALVQVGLIVHQVHHLEKSGHVPCELCLVGGGHCVTLPAAVMPSPDVARRHEMPRQARLPAALSIARVRPRARAPPA